MKHAVLIIAALGIANAAHADVTSAYTGIDLKKCRQTEKADNEAFAGAWRCKGYGGYDVFVSSGDDRDSVAFGKTADKNCAGAKTFNGFNAAGGKVEWRVKNGKPIAAILRWTVSIDPEDSTKTATWLVVSKLEKGAACQMHYVNGAFPNANDAARKAADKAEAFVCKTDVPAFDSTIGEPGISLEPCGKLPE